VDPISAVLINKALDGLSMRSQASAQNIANANSPGYRPVRVVFEEALRAASRSGANAIEQVAPALELAPGQAAADGVRLDMELATASETAMRYTALIDLLSRQLQISRTVIRGGQ
jgi:flagellar basal-body rod protein FlgB